MTSKATSKEAVEKTTDDQGSFRGHSDIGNVSSADEKRKSTLSAAQTVAIARREAEQRQRREAQEREARNRKSRRLLEEFEARQRRKKYMQMARIRAKLPSVAMQSDIAARVEAHQVTVISGATGCGKSTQVPQFILDAMLRSGRGAQCNIVCTQPRSLAAIGVADRVSAERAR